MADLTEHPVPAAGHPAGAELVDARPGATLVLIRYHGADPVRVRQRGAAPWRCSHHGAGTTCRHVVAAMLTLAAWHVLTATDPNPTKENRTCNN